MTEIKDVTVATKINIDSDLAECSVLEAMGVLWGLYQDVPSKEVSLIAGPDDAVVAGRLAEKYGFRVIQLPEYVIQRDAWALFYEYHCVGSPGA